MNLRAGSFELWFALIKRTRKGWSCRPAETPAETMMTKTTRTPTCAIARGLMMAGLDFGKLTKRSVVETATEPRRIFAALPVRASKYARPWDMQAQMWDRCHERRRLTANSGRGRHADGHGAANCGASTFTKR
jgi:hypothetical protein